MTLLNPFVVVMAFMIVTLFQLIRLAVLVKMFRESSDISRETMGVNFFLSWVCIIVLLGISILFLLLG